jgi:hypothetical protein
MTESLLHVIPGIEPPLDPGFRPAALGRSRYREAMGKAGTRVLIGLEREGGLCARHELEISPACDADTLKYVERTVKFLLWSRGGWRIHISGPRAVGEHIQRSYAPEGFDAGHMAKVYERSLEVLLVEPEAVPEEKNASSRAGGHLDGCRIGFDLGASDYKVAAVKDGEAVYSNEFPWNPRDESDPNYHYRHIQSGLKKAAEHLPRVDAIGGSSAGVYIDNRPMAASLFRSIPPEKFEQAVKPMFIRIGREWGVPLRIINDGDVTALAGTLSLKENALLGVAMGSSEAAGYMDTEGRITGWLNELAFCPVDYNEDAVPDEWSGDVGVGSMYFSQQAVNRLLPASGIEVPVEMGLPERLVEVQHLMTRGDERACRIFETIGIYLGYAVPCYAEFYDMKNLLILGRVTSGEGGSVILARAAEVLDREFPSLEVALHVPDEKSKRVGQAVAAASLPEIGNTC